MSGRERTSLRLVNWNINNLCGVSGEGASAKAAAELLLGLDADVIVLQEVSQGHARLAQGLPCPHTSRSSNEVATLRPLIKFVHVSRWLNM